MAILALVFVLKPPYPHANAQTGSLTKREEAKVAVVSAPVASPAPTPTATIATEPVVETPKPAPVDNGWHYDCRPQVAAVQEATARLLGANATYANWIFSHESCMDPGRLNSIGCKGLGQSCGHASFTCGSGDIDCQVLWFNNYALAKGGWARCQQIWISQNWW